MNNILSLQRKSSLPFYSVFSGSCVFFSEDTAKNSYFILSISSLNFSAKLSARFFKNSWEGRCLDGIILHKTCKKVVTPDVGRDSKDLVSLRTALENMFSCVTVLSNQLQFWDNSECIEMQQTCCENPRCRIHQKNRRWSARKMPLQRMHERSKQQRYCL